MWVFIKPCCLFANRIMKLPTSENEAVTHFTPFYEYVIHYLSSKLGSILCNKLIAI